MTGKMEPVGSVGAWDAWSVAVIRSMGARTPFTTITMISAQRIARPAHTSQRPPPPLQPPRREGTPRAALT
ncbi:hypothetical protein GCM10009530_31260 [Microbispora corallina]|uniref:Uncharacterized protein n=1 Tax=Microbispora corallina TaxID=83302 RepID=A0ABQ4G0F3_9ACTN|nr:hypothetical protein Mco01_35440 [Microbispora corallina]